MDKPDKMAHKRVLAAPQLKEVLYFFSQGATQMHFICQGCFQFHTVRMAGNASCTTFVCTCKHHSLIDWEKSILHTGSYVLQEE